MIVCCQCRYQYQNRKDGQIWEEDLQKAEQSRGKKRVHLVEIRKGIFHTVPNEKTGCVNAGGVGFTTRGPFQGEEQLL